MAALTLQTTIQHHDYDALNVLIESNDARHVAESTITLKHAGMDCALIITFQEFAALRAIFENFNEANLLVK